MKNFLRNSFIGFWVACAYFILLNIVLIISGEGHGVGVFMQSKKAALCMGVGFAWSFLLGSLWAEDNSKLKE